MFEDVVGVGGVFSKGVASMVRAEEADESCLIVELRQSDQQCLYKACAFIRQLACATWRLAEVHRDRRKSVHTNQ